MASHLISLAAIKQKKTALTITAMSTRMICRTVLARLFKHFPSDDINHICTTGSAESQLSGGMHVAAVGHRSQFAKTLRAHIS